MCGGLEGGGNEKLYTHHRRPQPNGRLPCIRSLRIPVATVVGMVGEGTAELIAVQRSSALATLLMRNRTLGVLLFTVPPGNRSGTA